MLRKGQSFGAALLALLMPCAALADADSPRPNILLIVADDAGYADIGSFGSEIQTPNIDALAAVGVRFTDFNVSATCSPTRSMMLTGVDNHLAGLGNMAEFTAPNQKGLPGYEGYLKHSVAPLPSSVTSKRTAATASPSSPIWRCRRRTTRSSFQTTGVTATRAAMTSAMTRCAPSASPA